MRAVDVAPFLSSEEIKTHYKALVEAENLNSLRDVFIQSRAQVLQPSYRQTESIQLPEKIKVFKIKDVCDALTRSFEEKSNFNKVFNTHSLENLYANKEVILPQEQRIADWLKIECPLPPTSSPNLESYSSNALVGVLTSENQAFLTKETYWFLKLVIGALIGGLGSRFAGFSRGAILANSIAGAILGTFL